MANKNFVGEARLNIAFSELSQKAFTKVQPIFWKRLSVENSIILMT